MLPRVKIIYDNGSIGSPPAFDDGVCGLITNGVAVAGKFELGKVYQVRSLADIEAMGITGDSGDVNAAVCKFVKEFYSEVTEGSELWLMALSQTVSIDKLVDKDEATSKVKELLVAANGKIRVLAAVHNPASGYTATLKNGLDAKVYDAMLKAQALAEWSTEARFAPMMVALGGDGYAGTPTNLSDLGEMEFNRVCCLIGDTVAGGKSAAVGLLVGRIAAIPVQRSVARKASGALRVNSVYVGDKRADVADVESISNKGFVTFRTFVGSAGYYFSDDKMACKPSDDYALIPRRRVIDKAARIAYQAMIERIGEEIPVNNDGTLVPAMAKSWQNELVRMIVNQMTAFGNLGTDPNDSRDTGVEVMIDYNQNVVNSSMLKVELRVKPYGYAKYIDVTLGFTTFNK